VVPEVSVYVTKNSEYTQILVDLGLTLLEAKTYFALATLGKTDVKTISKASNVVREEIYRIMPKLEEIGLVEKIIDRPTLYKALPLKEGLSILIQRRTKKNLELQNKTRALIQNLQKDNLRNTVQEENSQFIITSETTLFRKRIDRCIQKAQTSIDIVISPKIFDGMIFYHFKNLKKALGKSVKIRVTTEKIEKETPPRNIGVFKKNPFFICKYLFSSIPVTMALFDNKEVNIRISDNLVPNLWSNNPEIVKLAASYFDEMWNRAK